MYSRKNVLVKASWKELAPKVLQTSGKLQTIRLVDPSSRVNNLKNIVYANKIRACHQEQGMAINKSRETQRLNTKVITGMNKSSIS